MITITADALFDALQHNESDGRGDDIWVVFEDGSLQIIPDQDIEPLQDPFSWPKYVGRAQSINQIVRGRNVDGALAFLNMIVGGTISAPSNSLAARAGAVVGRFVSARFAHAVTKEQS